MIYVTPTKERDAITFNADHKRFKKYGLEVRGDRCYAVKKQ